MKLKYSQNPYQKNANVDCIIDTSGKDALTLRAGNPSEINIMDALTSWQLVKEGKLSTGYPCAASFKHVNPAGVAICFPDEEKQHESLQMSPIARAYIKARACDPVSSFGDFIAVSEIVDASLAKFIRSQVSDGIIAPGYDSEALEILSEKKKGSYTVLEIDPQLNLPETEIREMFGFRITHDRNTFIPPKNEYAIQLAAIFSDASLVEIMATNICLSSIALKYTISNSIAIATGGQVIGISAAQQSRVGSTRLACGKADKWFFAQAPEIRDLSFREGTKSFERNNVVDILFRWNETSDDEKKEAQDALAQPIARDFINACQNYRQDYPDLCLVSDGFIPFIDNIHRAKATGVKCVVHPGGGNNDEVIKRESEAMGIAVIETGTRLFYH